ncbi:MAG: hypothetical protein ACPL7D_00115 [Candidatus Sumerlaeaceae bacterium]
MIVRYPYEANFGEGGVLFDAIRLARGETIYAPAAQGVWISPYPPLFAWLVSLWPTLNFLWPRLLSQLSHLLSAACLVALLRRTQLSWPWAMAAALLWLTNPFIRTFAAMGRVDSLGRMLESISLLAAVSLPTVVGKVAAAALLSAMAMSTKQTMFTSALALSAFWWRQRRLRSLSFIFAWLFATLCCYLIVAAILGRHFFANVFWDVRRQLSLAFLWPWLVGFLFANVVLLVLSILGMRAARRDRVGQLFLWATLASFPLILLAAQDGADVNYFFDVTWALCGLAAFGLGSLTTTPTFRRSAALLALAIGILVFEVLIPPRYPTPDQFRRAQEVAQLLAQSSKPLLTEFIGFGLRAGSDPPAVPYIDRILDVAGVRPADKLAKQVEAREFGAVQITNQAGARWPIRVLEAIDKHYRLEREFPEMFASEGEPTFFILVPKP